MSEEMKHDYIIREEVNYGQKMLILHLGSHEPKIPIWNQDISMIEFRYENDKLIISSEDFFKMMKNLYSAYKTGRLGR